MSLHPITLGLSNENFADITVFLTPTRKYILMSTDPAGGSETQGGVRLPVVHQPQCIDVSAHGEPNKAALRWFWS